MTAQPILFFLNRWAYHAGIVGMELEPVVIPAQLWDGFADAIKDSMAGPAYPTDRIEKMRQEGDIVLSGFRFTRRHTPAPMHKRKAK